MTFRKIDRTITRSFLACFVGVIVLLSVLYLSFDVLRRLDNLQEGGMGRMLPLLATYYGCLAALFAVDIVPGVVLLAGGFVLVGMAKRNELLALKACGTSLHRAIAPILVCTLALSVAAFGVREGLGPHLVLRREMLARTLEGEVDEALLLRDAGYSRRLFIGQYDYAHQTMRLVTDLEFRPDDPLRLRRVIRADSGVWEPDGRLTLQTVEMTMFDDKGAFQERTYPVSVTLETDLGPQEVLLAAEDSATTISTMLSLGDLRRQIRQGPAVAQVRVLYHSRLAAFFSPIVLLLVGIPFLVGFERSVESRFLSVVVSILVAAGFYALSFIFSSMGETRTIPALVAGWLPTIAGGSAGLWLFQAMLT